MTRQPDIRRPRRNFPPDMTRRIRIENTALAVGTVVFWLAAGAVFGRLLRVW